MAEDVDEGANNLEEQQELGVFGFTVGLHAIAPVNRQSRRHQHQNVCNLNKLEHMNSHGDFFGQQFVDGFLIIRAILCLATDSCLVRMSSSVWRRWCNVAAVDWRCAQAAPVDDAGGTICR